MIHLYDIRLSLGQDEAVLCQKTADLLGIPRDRIGSFRVIRRSLDARRERPPELSYLVEIDIAPGQPGEAEILREAAGRIKCRPVEPEPTGPGVARVKLKKRPVVVGCGPAGLFAALRFAESGNPPLLIERGKRVEERIRDIEAFWSRGVLNPESNVHFGEGGAGTFSDGKLTTRIKSSKADYVKKALVELGAPSEILIEAKPHVGTDRLRRVLLNLRGKLAELGCEMRFGGRVTDLRIRNGRMEGAVINDQEEIDADILVWAAGQSCAESYTMLNARGIALAPKAFAIGLRVEHPQELINRIQYGKWWNPDRLPPAEYVLTAKAEEAGRSVYTFCMCPGGQVIGCSSEPGALVTNGMSLYRRDGAFANSAVVVSVHPDDFDPGSPLAGLQFRRTWEERAFAIAGGDYFAPGQKMTDFLDERISSGIGPTTFRPGIRSSSLDGVLPEFAVGALRRGILSFERKMPGFITSEAVLIGVETRTSSPVRILRDDHGRSTSTEGFYPCGEGSGYAGGIISSAVDGIKAAESVLLIS